jgi:DNA-binding CsgD family transcriptional regulator
MSSDAGRETWEAAVNGVVLRGRSEAMSSALALIRQVVRTGQGGGLVVTGEAGIGKSALLSAVMREAGRLGVRCGSVKADRIGRIVPGGPLLTGLREGADPVLPADAFRSLGSAADQPLLLLEAIASALELRAAERPIVVAVDDAQWLDDLSAFLLRSLPGRLAGSPVAWLMASRAEELPVFEGLCGGLADDLPSVRLVLDPLADSDIIAIARDHLGTAPGSATRQMLGRAGGNPVLAVQVINGLLQAQAGGGDPASVPAQLMRAVRGQLQALPAGAIELVRLAAVYGEPLPLDEVADLLDGVSARAVAEAADEAIEAGVLSRERGSLLFRHGLVRESVYADLPERTRQFIHLTCARHLRHSGYDALAVASHAREAITPGDEAVALLLADAAGDAVATMPKTAAELLLAAFAALRPGQPAWLGVGERCVEVLSLVQRCTDALEVAERLLAYLDDDESAGRLEVALSRALWLTGRWEEAEERTRAALERPGLPAALRARLEALHALALARVRSPALARKAAERALSASGDAADRAGRLFALHALAEVARNAGDHRTSLSYFRQLRSESEPAYVAQEIMALQHLDRYGHAETMLAQAWQQSGNDSASILPSLLYAQIWQDYNLARLDGADAAARTLMRLGAELGSRICQLESAAILTATALVRGDAEEARRRIPLGGRAEAAELAHIPVLMLVRGWLLAEEGDPAMAVACLTPLLKATADELDPWPWKPGWTRMLTRAGLAAGDTDFASRAVELAEEGARRNPGVATFEAIAQGLRGLLDHDLERLAGAADVVTRSPRPLVRAGVLEDYGRALLAAGEVVGGGERLDQAWELYDEVGARGCRSAVQQAMRAAGIRRSWWTSAQSRPADGWASLTEAEIRVAKLIADGQTNKSAAAQLGVSANTVGTHLRSVFAKLGVRSRVQLTNLLHEREPGADGLGAVTLRRGAGGDRAAALCAPRTVRSSRAR